MAENKVQFEFIKLLGGSVKRAGGSMEQVLAMSGLERTPVIGGDERIKQESDAVALLQSAIELTKDPTLPFRLGHRFDVTSLGSYGFAIMSCGVFGDCLSVMKRYQKTLGAGPNWRVLDQGDGIAIRTTITLGSADQRRVASELVFSQLCSTAEFLINRPLQQAELHLCYPAPSYAAEYQRLLAIPVIFDQPHSQLIVPKNLLNSPVRNVNPAGHMVFLQQCEVLLRSQHRVENTSTAVRRLLLQSAGDFPSAGQTARSLNLSERTLRRRLDAEANSFRAIKEEVKKILAQNYLANTELSVAEIAILLGYSETVNFRQAFVRWHGITPSQFRQQS